MLEAPSQLAARFERGEIERAEFQALMAIHARDLIAEIEEDHENPVAAWVEGRLARSAVKRLVRRHRPALIREIFVALADAAPPAVAKYLWNAGHADVPLHCFFRMRKDPVLRILSIEEEGNLVRVLLQFPNPKSRVEVRFFRDRDWRLSAEPFAVE